MFAEVRDLARIPQKPLSNILLLLISRWEFSSRERPKGPLWWISFSCILIVFSLLCARMPSLAFSNILFPLMSHSPAFGPIRMPWKLLLYILFSYATSFPPSLASKQAWWFLYISHFLTSIRENARTRAPLPPQSWIAQSSISAELWNAIDTPGKPPTPDFIPDCPNLPVRSQAGLPKEAATHPGPPLHSGKSSQLEYPPEISQSFKWIVELNWQTRPTLPFEKRTFSK